MKVYALASGFYSDYGITAIFEREEDATEYGRRCWYNSSKATHDRIIRGEQNQPFHTAPQHTEPFETCQGGQCPVIRQGGEDALGDWYVQEFDYYPVGVIPAVTK